MKNNWIWADNLLMPVYGYAYALQHKGVSQVLIKNLGEVVLYNLGIKKEIVIDMKFGGSYKVNSKSDYYKFWDSDLIINGFLSFFRSKNLEAKLEKDRVIIKEGSRRLKFGYSSKEELRSILHSIMEVYIVKEYNWFRTDRKWTALDIGASIGDTAICFCVYGADKVYSYEPYRHSYEIAKWNIKLNNLSNKVVLYQEGAGMDKKIKIDPDYKNNGADDLKESKTGEIVQIRSLASMIKINKIEGDCALKVDCEGGEYDLILNASRSDLKKFYKIIIEYHYGYLNLARKLKHCGFKVMYSRPRRENNPRARERELFMGMLHAERI